MHQVADLLSDPDFCTHLIILRRTESLVKGRSTITTAEEPAIGVVQPAPGKELERLPEGDRNKETLLVFTAAPLGVGSDDSPQKADGIVHAGAVYTVASAESWPLYGFTKALCQKEGAMNEGGGSA